MTQFSDDQEFWVPCAPGTLAKYASRRRQRRRRLVAIKAMGVALVALLAVVVGWGAIRLQIGPKESNFGGIACHDVERLMPQYVNGELAAEMSDKIRRHVAECPDCREMLRRMKQEPAPAHVGRAIPNRPNYKRRFSSVLAVTSERIHGQGPPTHLLIQ